jgi:hypothetical protein
MVTMTDALKKVTMTDALKKALVDASSITGIDA